MTTNRRLELTWIESDDFFEGAYRGKVIQVDSSTGSGAERDEIIERLLKVEHRDEPTEIVIHVNMLKEGWDVTNLYTIVPLRAATARVLIEQTIGRGLRLPYGKRTGVAAVDRLSIVAHDRFQEIIDEANRPDSPIQLKAIVIDPEELEKKPRTVVAPPVVETMLGITPDGRSSTTEVATGRATSVFTTPQEQRVAELTYRAVQTLRRDPAAVPDISYLQRPDVQQRLVAEVQAQYSAGQTELPGVAPAVDIAQVVGKATEVIIQGTISIPKVIVVPKDEVHSGFHPFTLDLSRVTIRPGSESLFSQDLRTGQSRTITASSARMVETRLEDYIVSELIDFDDISYDDTAELLYDLSGQVVRHLQSYLDEDEVAQVLRTQSRELAKLVHAQMQDHYWEDTGSVEAKVTEGFVEIRSATYTHGSGPRLNFRHSPADKSNMARYLFEGFERCLHPVQKFDSEAERLLAVILDRDALKWIKPALGQFRIAYRLGSAIHDYNPDFVAELPDRIAMIEPKRRTELDAPDVQAKKAAAIEWCAHASAHAAHYGGKPWSYHLIPHDAIAENWSLASLLARHQ